MATLALCLLIFFDSAIGFVSGFGTSTLLMPILLFWYPLQVVLILTGLLHLLNNLNKVLFFISKVQWRLLILFGLPAIIFSFIGAQLVPVVDQQLLIRLIGILLILYTILKLWRGHTITITHSIGLIFSGSFYGFTEGLVGIGGALRAAIFNSYNLSPAAYIASNGLIACLVDISRLSSYLSHGLPTVFSLPDYGLFIMVTILGAVFGKLIVNHVPAVYVQRFVLASIALVGLKLAILP